MLAAVLFSAALGAAVDTSHDDWTDYAHDQQRTGFQRQATGITTANVTGLNLRWKVTLKNGGGYASPLVAAGSVYLVSSLGVVTSLNANNGAVRWTHALAGMVAGQPLLATPTLAAGVLYTVEHNRLPHQSNITALRASDGGVLWSKALPGPSHGAPLVANGYVYAVSSQSDTDEGEPTISGGVTAYRTSDGSVAWMWQVDPTPGNGGGIWANGALKNRNLYYGTSNIIAQPNVNAQTVVTLDALTGGFYGHAIVPEKPVDDDFGAGDTIVNATLYTIGKSGMFYGFPLANGATACSVQLGAADEQGGIATPASDGGTLVVSGGYFGTPPNEGRLFGLGLDCRVLWEKPMAYASRDYAAMIPGLAFENVGNMTEAIELVHGNTLWAYAGDPTTRYYNAPVIVPSGLYTEDAKGNVYAFR